MDQLTPPRRFNSPLVHPAPRTRRVKRTALLLAAAPIFWGSLALAQDFWLNPSGGSWTTAANWSAGVPNSNNATFNLGSTVGYTVTVPSVQSTNEVNVETDNVILSMTGSLQVGFGGGGPVLVGTASGQNGSLTLHGATLGVESGVTVGTAGGVGALTTTTTVETFQGAGFTVGNGTGSQGTINVNAGGFLDPDFPGPLDVGQKNGTGTVNINGGSVNNVMPVFGQGGTGTLALTNKGSLSTGDSLGDMVVGENGSTAGMGTVTCDGNSSIDVEDGSFDVGEASPGQISATGTATFTNGGNLFADGNLNVGTGVGGNGSVSILSGSTVSIIDSTIVGANGGTGSLRVSGANSLLQSLVFGTAFVGEDSSSEAGTGTLQVDTQGKINLVGTLTVASGGTLNVLSGGTLSAQSIDLSSAGSVNLTGGTVNLTGGTLIDAALTLPNTTTLEGTGSLTGNLSSFGTVSPGDAPGILTVDDNYTENSSGTLDIGIGGTTLGTQYDQLKIDAAANLDGALDISLLNGFVPAVGNQFDILAFGSETGSFTYIGLPALPAGRAWDTSQLDSSGIISVVVPEPASAALLLTAGFGLAMRRRRKC